MFWEYTKFLRMLVDTIPKRVSRQSESNRFCLALIFPKFSNFFNEPSQFLKCGQYRVL